MRNICIVTSDIQGPTRNGGIGTAFTNLAKLLSAADYKVTLLYVRGNFCESRNIEHWIHHYAAMGIQFIPLPHFTRHVIPNGNAMVSFHIYQWLKENRFDVIHFHEWQGVGYYSLLAKRLGLAFSNTEFCVGLHSPTLWHLRYDQQTLNRQEDLATDFMERKSAELCDTLVSPSAYMLRWARSQDWKLPKDCRVIPNIYSESLHRPERVTKANAKAITEIAFFGRLEMRKGLALFCKAIESLEKEIGRRGIKVSFLGKVGLVDGQNAMAYLSQRFARSSLELSFQVNLSSQEALAYLVERDALVVLPSLAENSPYTLVETATSGLRFLVANSGGVPELIKAKDRDRVFFESNAEALTEKLAWALEFPEKLASQVFLENAATDVSSTWLRFHKEAVERAVTQRHDPDPRPEVVGAHPTISVCIVHRNRPHSLAHALESLKNQTYVSFEVILVDDGSDLPEAIQFLDSLQSDFTQRDWKIIRQKNLYLGAARNNAAKNSRGQYLLFMDDDNEAEPFELEVFAKAAVHSGADILTCGFNIVYQEGTAENEEPLLKNSAAPIWLPLGGAVALGFYTNCFGDANALVKRDVFQALNGFSEDFGLGFEDWEFFAKALLAGYRLEVVPEPLFWYRRHLNSITAKMPTFDSRMRSARPYFGSIPKELGQALVLAQGAEALMRETQATLENVLDNGEPASEALFRSHRARTLFRIDRETGFGVIQLQGVTYSVEEEGALKFEASDHDPNLILPVIGLPRTGDIVVKVDLTTPHGTWVELFYSTDREPFYSDDRKLGRRSTGGRSLVHFRLPAENIQGQLRLDPGDCRGIYALHYVEIRVIPPTPKKALNFSNSHTTGTW